MSMEAAAHPGREGFRVAHDVHSDEEVRDELK